MNRLIISAAIGLFLLGTPAATAAASPPGVKAEGAVASPRVATPTPSKAKPKGTSKAKPKTKKVAPAIWLVIPFALMLLGIAVLPLTLEHFWESNRNKFLLSFALGIPVALYFALSGSENQAHLTHTLYEYIAFMCLLGSLYVISGGILLRGDMAPTPSVNTGILALGAVLASFMGTTGAAMLLIRPLITINAHRKDRVHTVIFFTFLVANIGGLLTPLGDPPLFMGYLRGVPFSWTFSLIPQWALMVSSLLIIYFIWDTLRWRADTEAQARLRQAQASPREPLSLTGLVNVPLLLGVVICVAFGTSFPVLLGSKSAGFGLREVAMMGLAVASWVVTSKKLRRDNEYTFHPIVEVAALFLGIFLTMIPAVVLLKVRGGELGVTQPWQFFWATGMLSSFLDNTPTYVVFFSLAEGDPATLSQLFSPELLSSTVATTTGSGTAVPEKILVAMSLGAVFMGANTYIGNGPNFMVKAIADERGVKMPSFFGYMGYSFLILVPLFVLYTFVWF